VRLRALEDAALQRGVAVVTGTDNAAHMKSDLDLFGFALAPAEVERISALKPPPA
jgi:diketogulonate reductase-like aldo/keto reductase